jgi:Tol biopolymer transport system component
VNIRRLLLLIALCVAVVPASSATASVPGPAGRIVFTSDQGGTSGSEVYSAAADGSDVKRLTWAHAFAQDPAWSPDGSRIAYESSDQSSFHLFVMNQDGSDRHIVPSDAALSSGDDVQPAWSPGGSQIAFSSTRSSGGSWHIWVMNADGTNLHELPSSFSQHPAWSPDGLRIAGDNGDGPLFVIDADGTNEHRLTTPPAFRYDESPDWSPEGSSLVFSERSFDGTTSALYAIGADGSGLRQLTSGTYADYRPSWSPDGTTIVFDRRSTASSFQLYTVGSAGGATTQLLSSPGNDMGPSWSSSTVSPVVSPPPAAIQIHIYSPADGGLYFPGSANQVFYACTSDVVFVASCDGSQPLGATLDTSSAGSHDFTVTAIDLQGNEATQTVNYTVFDFTPPTIDLHTPLDGGTYDLGANLTVDFGCSDGQGGSGVLFCSGTLPSGAPLDTSHAGSFTFRVTALDNDFNLATATATYAVVDRVPPTVTITTPADQAVYKQNQVVPADYACSDRIGGSGVLSCSGNVNAGTGINTTAVGAHSFTVTATKAAHITTTLSHSYNVVYDFSGFFTPVSAFPTVNPVKAGEGIPLKFSLHGSRGSDIFAAASPAWSPCDSPATNSTIAPGSLTYNASLDRYGFLAATDKSWAGTCKDLSVTLRDGTTHQARFSFSK